MPFRDPKQVVGPGLDPLARFTELEAAFDEDRGFGGDRVPLRLAAASLILTPGEAKHIVTQVRMLDEELAALAPWYARGPNSMRLLIAAVLHQHGDEAGAYQAELERVRGELRRLRMRRNEMFETMAILVLRIQNELEPITEAQLERFKAVHGAMKREHRWLTGVDDYPACAFLVGQEGSPEEVAGRARAIYDALREHASVWRGESLQTASNMLALSALDPVELATRFANLASALGEAGISIGIAEYDEVALLCFLSRPIPKIVETLLGYREHIRSTMRWAMSKQHAFSLAVNLAYVRLLGDEALGPLGDLKTLLDMQTIIAARQAAAAAAAAGSA